MSEIPDGKRTYIARLKRNFGGDPAASLCPRLHETVEGEGRDQRTRAARSPQILLS